MKSLPIQTFVEYICDGIKMPAFKILSKITDTLFPVSIFPLNHFNNSLEGTCGKY